MKAVIVECSNGAAVALCDDGTFRKIKNRDYAIGQELLIKEKITPNHMMQKLSICASLALVLLSFVGIGSYSYTTPYSFVSLDINPSIEYALNRYDKVIAVSGINDKGQQVVASIESDVKNQNITTALGVTIKQLEKENYIVQKEYNHVIVSVCSSNDTKAKSIASRVDNFSAQESSACAIDTMTVSKEIKDNADSLGITPGKLALIHAVAETTSDSNFDVSAWTDKSVSELETTIQQASSQFPDSVEGPVTVTVIDSAYLSSVLDDSTANNSDSTSTASAVEANTEAGSTTTDKQMSTNQDTTTGSGKNEPAVDPKPDDTKNDSTTVSVPGNVSADHTSNANQAPDAGNQSAENNTGVDSSNATNQNNSDKETDKNMGSDSSKENSDETSASDTDTTTSTSNADENGKNDNSLIEESSSKKDSYPIANVDQLADSSNKNTPANEQVSSDKEDTSTKDVIPGQEGIPEQGASPEQEAFSAGGESINKESTKAAGSAEINNSASSTNVFEESSIRQ